MTDMKSVDRRLAELNQPLSAWYAQVRAESKEIFQSGPITADNLSERADEALRIAKAHAGEGSWREVYALLDELCTEYVRSNAEQGSQIRIMVSKYPSMIRAVGDDYVGRAITQLETTGDPRWLWLGLAAISIENNSIDFRDTYIILGRLYLTATGLGIDPKPVFQAIARVSASDVKGSTSSIPMRKFLDKFHKSSYFRTEVSPRLR